MHCHRQRRGHPVIEESTQFLEPPAHIDSKGTCVAVVRVILSLAALSSSIDNCT